MQEAIKIFKPLMKEVYEIVQKVCLEFTGNFHLSPEALLLLLCITLDC